MFLPHVEAELQTVAAARPREIVRELEYLVHALDERLLRVAEAEEAGHRDGRESLGERVGVRHVDPEILVLQTARDRGMRVDAVV